MLVLSCSVTVLADVEWAEAIEGCRRVRPVARIVPPPPIALRRADRSQAEKRLPGAYPIPVGGMAAARTVEDGRGDR